MPFSISRRISASDSRALSRRGYLQRPARSRHCGPSWGYRKEARMSWRRWATWSEWGSWVRLPLPGFALSNGPPHARRLRISSGPDRRFRAYTPETPAGFTKSCWDPLSNRSGYAPTPISTAPRLSKCWRDAWTRDPTYALLSSSTFNVGEATRQHRKNSSGDLPIASGEPTGQDQRVRKSSTIRDLSSPTVPQEYSMLKPW